MGDHKLTNFAGHDVAALSLMNYHCEELRDLLKKVLPDPSGDLWGPTHNAEEVIKSALGFLPYSKPTNDMSDDEVKQTIPQLQAMIRLAEALLAFKQKHGE